MFPFVSFVVKTNPKYESMWKGSNDEEVDVVLVDLCSRGGVRAEMVLFGGAKMMLLVAYVAVFILIPMILTWYAAWRVIRNENSRWVWAAGPVFLYWAYFAWQLHWNFSHWW